MRLAKVDQLRPLARRERPAIGISGRDEALDPCLEDLLLASLECLLVDRLEASQGVRRKLLLLLDSREIGPLDKPARSQSDLRMGAGQKSMTTERCGVKTTSSSAAPRND